MYITAIYWAITILTTVGFGDVVPGTNMERFVTIACMCFGVAFYSYAVGSISSVLSTIDSRRALLETKLQAIQTFA